MPMIDSCAEAAYRYIRDHWNAPSFSKVRGTVLCRSSGAASALEVGGYITRRIGWPRTIEITSKPLPTIAAGLQPSIDLILSKSPVYAISVVLT
jgi:hypothetical protein